MRPVAAPARHPAHDSKVRLDEVGACGRMPSLFLVVSLSVLGACGPSLPRPPIASVRTEDYVAVPQPPQQPIVEVVPPRPERIARAWWIDGGWEWGGSRYRWRSGGWVDASALPPGARYAPWAITRRKEDGQLFFAPSTFRDASGATVRTPPFVAPAEVSPGEAAPEGTSGGGSRGDRRGGASGGPPLGRGTAVSVDGSPSKIP